MSRVLLVNPPFYRLLGSHYNANSLGIAYIASVLNQHGHDAWLYNADYRDGVNYAGLEEIFNSHGNYLTYFNNTNADIWEEVVDHIVQFNPDWIGYTSYTANIAAINIISEKVKTRLSNVIQVIGGVHATLDPNILQTVPFVDYAVRREGEFAMLSLVNGEYPDSIEGVVTREKQAGDSPVIRDIDSLPFPEREKFWGLTSEQRSKVDVSYICSVRGCPYRCNYCASPFHWKRDKTQFRSPPSVLAEMKHIKSNYWNQKGYDYSASANTSHKRDLLIPDNTIVYFVDDIFTIRKRRAKDIMRQMIEEDLDMPWKCEVRADHLDEELCELMNQSNCVRVKIGFESGSDRILKAIKKDESKEQMLLAARMLRAANVPFTAYFMAGFPSETDEDLRQTIEFAKEIDADYYSLSILAPYYGTQIYFDLLQAGVSLDKKNWEYFYHQSGDLLANTTLSQDMVQEYLSLASLNSNYI